MGPKPGLGFGVLSTGAPDYAGASESQILGSASHGPRGDPNSRSGSRELHSACAWSKVLPEPEPKREGKGIRHRGSSEHTRMQSVVHAVESPRVLAGARFLRHSSHSENR